MQLLNIGFGNIVSLDKILAIVSPDAAPVKRIISEAKDKGMLIDASCGKKTQSVIIAVTNHVILSSVSLKQLTNRLNNGGDNSDEQN